MGDMEVRGLATIEDAQLATFLQLLTALAGHQPHPAVVHELVLKHSTQASSGRQQDITLRHVIIPADNDYPAADRWYACQYGRPPWGDIAMSKFPASVRTVTNVEVDNDNHDSKNSVVLSWLAKGFTIDYQSWKQGYSVDIHRNNWTVQIFVSRMYKVASLEGSVQAGDQVAPGHVLIEAWTEVTDAQATSGLYKEAIAAVSDTCKLLKLDMKPLVTKPRQGLMMPQAPPR